MTVTLNEAAIVALFQSVPVVSFVEREADKVADAMRADVRSYFVGAETGVEDDVAVNMDGSTAIVGLQNDPQHRSTHAESKAARYARLGQFRQTREAARGS